VVVEAMNSLDEFIIEYPDSEEAQLKLACEFQSVSEVKFSYCTGAIDGILIWILKPSDFQLGRKTHCALIATPNVNNANRRQRKGKS
jgi:hypothetical protein